jgi:hypothetical protein
MVMTTGDCLSLGLPRGLYQEPWGLKQQAWGFSMIFHHVTVSSVTPGRMFGVKNGVC